MIMIKIEMWPGGDSSRKRDLAAVAIANVGGDSDNGDYVYSVSHQIDTGYGKHWAGHEAFAETVGAPSPMTWKTACVKGFARRAGAVKLLKAALKGIR